MGEGGSEAPQDSSPGSAAQRVLRWRLPAFGLLALVGLVLLATGWASVRDGVYLTGVLLTALGGTGVLLVLLWRRPSAATAVAAGGAVVLGLGLGLPWWQVTSAYSHDGVALQETSDEAPIGPDRGFLLVRDNQVVTVDDAGTMYPWWDGTVREDTQVSQTSGNGALIYHGPRAEGIVYLLDPEDADEIRWRFELPQEREASWWDGGVVSVTPQTVVTHWCDGAEDCRWTGHDAESGEESWTVSGIPVPNSGLGSLGLSSAGATGSVDGFWVGTRTEDGEVQLRDPDTGSVVHSLDASEPVALAGERAVVGSVGEETCTLQVLGTSDDHGDDEAEDGEEDQGPPSAEADCEVVQDLVTFPGELDYLDADLLWLPGTSRSHVIDLASAQSRIVDDRVFGGRSSTGFYGPGGSGSPTAGAGVLAVADARRVSADDPLTGEGLWQAPLSGAVPDSVTSAPPVVIAAGDVVTVQMPDPPMLLEDSLHRSTQAPMLLHAYEASTGEEVMPLLRHRQGPDTIEIHDDRLLLTISADDEPDVTYMFGVDEED